MTGERQKAIVSLEVIEAFAEPKFVLEFEGKIYVTQAVLEYNPDDPSMNDDLRADVEELKAMLDGPRPVSGTVFGAPQEAAAIAQSEANN